MQRDSSKTEGHSAEPPPPHLEAGHFAPPIPTQASQNAVTPPPSVRHMRWMLRPSTREMLTASAWGALCIAVLAGSVGDSAAGGALSANSRILYYGLLLSALVVCRLAPFERRAPAVLADFYRAWLSLPLPLLLCALAWLFGLGIATQTSIASFLSIECSQLSMSLAIAGALVFGYAARGLREVTHIVGGLIAALDVAIATATVRWLSQTASSTPIDHNGQLFSMLFACALPLAWNEAARETRGSENKAARISRATGFKVLWLRAEAVYRRVRPGIILGLLFTLGSMTSALVLFAAWMAHVVLRARGFVLAGAMPPFVRFWQFYLPTLFNGFLLCCFFTAWMAWQAAPDLALSQSTTSSNSYFDFPTVLAEVRTSLFERPLFGSGPGAFGLRVPEFGRAASSSTGVFDAPSSWLRALLESGLVTTLAALGACCFIGVRALFTFWRAENCSTQTHARDSQMPALLASLLALAVASCVFDLSLVPFLGFLGATVLALVAASFHAPIYADAKLSRRLLTIKQGVLQSILLIVALWLMAGAPRTWRSLQAHQFYERAQQAGTATTRFEQLLQARDREPENAFYWAQLGIAKYQLGGPPVARATTNFLRQAAHRAPQDALWWHNLGALYLIANDYPQAVHNLNRAVEADPNWWLTHRCLAHALEKQGDHKRSREERNIARLLWSKYFDPATRASLSSLEAFSHRRIYRRASTANQIIVPPALLADREFFVVNSHYFQSSQ